jgi:hypothetical protein
VWLAAHPPTAALGGVAGASVIKDTALTVTVFVLICAKFERIRRLRLPVDGIVEDARAFLQRPLQRPLREAPRCVTIIRSKVRRLDAIWRDQHEDIIAVLIAASMTTAASSAGGVAGWAQWGDDTSLGPASVHTHTTPRTNKGFQKRLTAMPLAIFHASDELAWKCGGARRASACLCWLCC